MPTLFIIVKIGIYVIMALSVIAALGVVTLRSLFHAAIALVFVLLGIAGIFLALHADFLAMVQILVYVGAVMTLVIFAVMLTERLGDKTIPQHNQQSWPALLGVVAFIAILSRIILSTPWPIKAQNAEATIDAMRLGEILMGPFVFPFEVISIVLIAALIGSIVIAKGDND